MSLYTKTGDKGCTSLANGERVSKASSRVEVYGTIDELNSHIGLLTAYIAADKRLGEGGHRELLRCIQCDLFTIGAVVAGSTLDVPGHSMLEEAIDSIAGGWRGFTLPGGCIAGAEAQLCRAVCRRAERLAVSLYMGDGNAPDATGEGVVVYLNRLSDYLYALGMKLNEMCGMEEVLWRK